MSTDTQPISPARFAEAIADLPLSSLHLKVLELRNNIAHLDYSNEQLRPFAEGTQTALSSTSSDSPEQQQQQPDPDCVEAIRENEQVIARMNQRIQLVRAEVEKRGVSWTEFQSKEELEAEAAVSASASADQQPLTNGVSGHGASAGAATAAAAEEETQPRTSTAWTDGTFQTGVIGSDGQLHMNVVAGGARTGGSLSDEELRRRMEEQMRGLGGDDDDDEGGLHL
ncbi:hypothetical protein B0T22DRAFT_61133 [Podospora appendiculata]|uniref:Uncharacterized protein n=1 Tax=Podospora appendiculata TaxID=314037 RepID=A0AAE1CH40_9PEZI|nr:hypothetical protein B0T22DRAFT_61133 [Podospora appendiculata]